MNDPEPSRETTPGGLALIHRITVGFTDRQAGLVKSFDTHAGDLAGLVLEMVRDRPECLLSPLMRNMLVEKAEAVSTLHRSLTGHLYADLQP
jgi:hypothetical protein